MFFTTALHPMLLMLPLQDASGTTAFYDWYYYGLGGLGGWFLFLLLGAGAAVWLLYDSQARRLNDLRWRLGISLLALLLLPTVLYRFTVTPVDAGIYQILQQYPGECPADVLQAAYPNILFQDCDQLLRSLPPLASAGEGSFYLGLLGGTLAPVLAIGYYLAYRGMAGCPQGHIYEKALEKTPGQCPRCEDLPANRITLTAPPPTVYQPTPLPPIETEPRPSPKPLIQTAWLLDLNAHVRYDLCEGTTLLGRSRDNDVILTDPAASRLHAQIKESSGYFTISDIDSTSGTLVNGKKIRTPLVLQDGDEITLGDTVLKFVSSN